MTLPTRATDASYDQLTVQEAQCLKSRSWPVYVQCLWTAAEQPAPRVISLRTAHQAGLQIAGYISLNATVAGRTHVDQGRAGVPDDLWDAMDFVAVDVELRGIRIGEILKAVDRVEELGKKVVIYTSYNAWKNYVTPGNSSLVSDRDVPLWNALWDLHPDFDFPTLRYGGWRDDQVFMEQWSGGTSVCGQFVDRNTIVSPELVYGQVYGGSEQPVQEVMRQLLTMNVPIWESEGQITLYQLLHRAYYAAPAILVEKLTAAVTVAQLAMENHITIHNQSGGALDRTSHAFLDRIADLLDQIEQEVRGA